MKTFAQSMHISQVEGQVKNLASELTVSGGNGSDNWKPGGTYTIRLSGELITGETEMEENNSNKWQFNALHERFIEFDDINKELDGANPIALVTYGGTERYVVVGDWIFEKIAILGLKRPDFLNIEKYIDGEGFVVYKIEGNFKEWVEWAKSVKRASWPPTRRKNNTVVASLPKI